MEKIVISQNQAGQRLDKFLEKYFKKASVGFLYKMLRKKNITLNGKKASGSELLQPEDTVSVFFSPETFSKMKGSLKAEYETLEAIEWRSLAMLYEDGDMAVIDKPAGILSQKAQADDVSLNEQFLSYLIHTGQLSQEEYETFHPSVANRLDYNTSGIILAGKTLRGQQELSRMLKQRELTKIYHCIVKGCIREERRLSGYLEKDDAVNRVTVSPKALPGTSLIETAYRPLQASKEATLLEVRLFTGKTHQIRAHLAFEGHPILGDPKYGDTDWNRRLKAVYSDMRQMLHAYSVTIPDKGVYVSAYPKDFQTLRDALFDPPQTADRTRQESVFRRR